MNRWIDATGRLLEWLLVLLISSLSLAGYAATRWLALSAQVQPVTHREQQPQFAGSRISGIGQIDTGLSNPHAGRTVDHLVAKLAAFAEARGQTPAETAIAWVLAKQPDFVPLVGARTPAQVASMVKALERPLSSAEVAELVGGRRRGGAAEEALDRVPERRAVGALGEPQVVLHRIREGAGAVEDGGVDGL